MQSLKEAPELQPLKSKGMAVILLCLLTPEKWGNRPSHGREEPPAIICTMSMENTFDRSLTRRTGARQAARHRWHSRWGKSSQLVWSQCCTYPRCFQGLSGTDLQWWMLLQTNVLLHTEDGERLLVFSPYNLPQGLVHTSIDLREMRGCPCWKQTHAAIALPLKTHYGITIPCGEPWASSSCTEPEKPVTCKSQREAQHPLLTDSAG